MIPAWTIYCEELPERRRAAEAHFAERGIVSRWWRGVHGATWRLTPTEQLTVGKVGLQLSHWHLWQHLQASGIGEALIFEDDAVLVEDFVQRLAVLRLALPDDWDYCYVGWYAGSDRSHVRPVPVNDLVGRFEELYPYGNFAALIRASALPFLLSLAGAPWPLDMAMGARILPNLKTYCSLAPLAVERTRILGEWPSSLD